MMNAIDAMSLSTLALLVAVIAGGIALLERRFR